MGPCFVGGSFLCNFVGFFEFRSRGQYQGGHNIYFGYLMVWEYNEKDHSFAEALTSGVARKPRANPAARGTLNIQVPL